MRSISFGWKLNTDESLKDLNRSNVVGLYQTSRLYQEHSACIKLSACIKFEPTWMEGHKGRKSL